MIVSQMMAIGAALRGKKSDYEILVDRYGLFGEHNLLVVDFDLWNQVSDIKMHIEEYDGSKRYIYGTGFLSGNKTNLTPCLRNYDVPDEDKLKRSIEKKVILLLTSSDNPLLVQLRSWLDENKSLLAASISTYLRNLGAPKREMPRAVVFRFSESDSSPLLFAGEHKAVQDFMVTSEMAYSSLKEPVIGTCHACGKRKVLRAPFNYGLVTFDQESFSLGFRGNDGQTQFRVCNDCYINCIHGYNIFEQDLKFWAYDLKKGASKTRIYYYVIPQTPDPSQLKAAVKTISSVKKRIIEGTKRDLEREIRALNNRLERADRSARSRYVDRIRRLERSSTLLEVRGDMPIDVPDVVEAIYQSGLGILVFYFSLAETPGEKPKEVVEHYYITGSHLSELGQLFAGMRRDYSRDQMQLWRLRNLTDDRMFLKVLEALFRKTEISRREFLTRAYRSVREEFTEKSVSNPNGNFRLYRIRDFMFFHDMLARAGLIGG